MKYNPEKHHRRSIRLKGYDYSQAGLYFITICTQDRACLFGDIRRGEPTCSPEMVLNDAGMMIEKWYAELENKFPGIRCHEMITMPNHFHCIIEIVGAVMGTDVEADRRVRPGNMGEGGHADPPLSAIVQWFKTMTTNEYIRGVKTLNWTPFHGKLWQRNYWEHIIRNEQSLLTIAEYILNNPKSWENDKLTA